MQSLSAASRLRPQLLMLVLLFTSAIFLTGCTGSGFSSTSENLFSNASSILSAATNESSSKYMGVNVSGLTDYSPQFFADAMKTIRLWGAPSTPCWGTDPVPALDTNGWPMGDAGACVITGNLQIEIGTYSLIFTGQATVTSILDNYVKVQNQVYNAATNTTTADVVTSTGVVQMMLLFKNTKRLPTDTVATGITNVRLWRPGQANQLFSQLFLDRIQAVSTFRLMDVLDTNGTLDSVWSGRRLPNYAIQKPLAPVNQGVAWEYVIQLANSTGKDIWVNVPDQATDDYVTKLAQLFKYGSDANGNPYTSTQANPVWAPLNSNIKLYFEYSNELWNWSFYQTTRNQNRANAVAWAAGTSYPLGSYAVAGGNLYLSISAISSATTTPTGTGQNITDGNGSWAYMTVFPANLDFDNAKNPGYNNFRFTAYRIMKFSDIFRAQFGDAAMGTQILPVYASQFTYGEVFRQGLIFLDNVYGPNNTYGNPQVPVNHYIYGLAGAPYWGIPSMAFNGPWPASCATTMATCTSYSTLPTYAKGAYATVNGNLYQAVTPPTQSWQSGKNYYSGTYIISGTGYYQCKNAIAVSATAPTGSGSGIADGSGTWNFVKAIPARAAPTGKTAGIVDGDGSWNYLYTYGDTTAATNQAFVDLNSQIDSFAGGATAAMTVFAGQAHYYGLQPLAYEGGLDTSIDTSWVDLVTSDAFQNDPRMGAAMLHFYKMWFANGGKLLNYFSLAGGYSKYGTWGMTQSYADPDTVRMQSFIQQATMINLPQITAGVAIPGTINLTDTYYCNCSVTGTQLRMAAATNYTQYEINVATAGTYVLTTTVSTNPIKILVDDVAQGQIAVGTGSTLTLTLSAGLHGLMVRPADSANPIVLFSSLVLTKQ